MSTHVLVLGAVSSVLVATGLAALVMPPRPRIAAQVRRYTATPRARAGRPMKPAGAPQARGGAARLLVEPLLAALRRIVRTLAHDDDAALELRLHQAGFDLTPDEHRMRLVGHGAAFAVGAALLAGATVRAPVAVVVAAACGGLVGASRWSGRIAGAIEARRERTRLELATVNQLLAMLVRAGAGPVQAVQRVVDRGSGVVVDELVEALGWMRHGLPEAEAFRRAADRTPEPGAARTYRLFAASAERGSDLGGALRSLSDDLRDARREELRRAATKRRAGMLVPIIGVLAPIMLLFVAAPIPSMVFGNR